MTPIMWTVEFLDDLELAGANSVTPLVRWYQTSDHIEEMVA